MRPAGEIAAEIGPTDRKLAGTAAGSFDSLKEQLRAVLERPSHQSKPMEDLHGSNDRIDEPLRFTPTLKGFQRPSPQRKPEEEDEPMERDDLRSGFTSRLDREASEREREREASESEAIYSRLVAIEKEMKRRGSRGFARYMIAICVGVAATLALAILRRCN